MSSPPRKPGRLKSWPIRAEVIDDRAYLQTARLTADDAHKLARWLERFERWARCQESGGQHQDKPTPCPVCGKPPETE